MAQNYVAGESWDVKLATVTHGQNHLKVVRGSDPAPTPAGERETQPDIEVSRALHDLISRFDSFVRRTAARHGLMGSDLDDVVQDLRVRIWRSFGTATAIRNASAAYLSRAAISASLDIIRRRRAGKSSGIPLDAVADVSFVERRAGPEEHVAAADLSRAVHEALGLLAESRRAVVRMYLAGYDRFEIADLLGWTEGKTRNLLYRGLEDLRGILTARGITGIDAQ